MYELRYIYKCLQMNRIIIFFEYIGFDVCSRLGVKIGIRTSQIRLFFIYLSFATIGFSYVFYLILAFLIKLKDLFIIKRKSVFDL